MKTSLQIVNRFLELTNNKKDIAGAVALMADDIRFTGPIMQLSGAQEYAAILEKFLPAHSGWKLLATFENGDEVCVIDEINLRTPAGGAITLPIAEWFKVSGNKILEHKIYYDPREFMQAFGM